MLNLFLFPILGYRVGSGNEWFGIVDDLILSNKYRAMALFFKIWMGIGILKECFGIADGCIFINRELQPLIDVQKLHFA